MGCSQSKIENEEAIFRCKNRKMFMKEAVGARNAFAAAHSAYTMALKNTGAALSDYGQGEAHDTHQSPSAAQPPSEQLPPPPPLPPGYPATNLLRSASMPDIPLTKSVPKPTETIIEEEDIEDDGGPTSSAPAPPPPLDPLPPPPPLDSHPRSNPVPPPPEPDNKMSWDFFFPSNEEIAGPSLSQHEDAHNDHENRPGHGHGYNEFKIPGDGMNDNENKKGDKDVNLEELEEVIEPSVKPLKKQVQGGVIQQEVGPSESKRSRTAASGLNLLQILTKLDDHFLKASESAQEVSKMLEANRLHYHSNFADNRGHIDHSARVMRVITWNRSFRGIPQTDEEKDDFEGEEWETHATVLDKLLAWEKKLYDEVKAGELMKIDYRKKVALLNKQKKRGSNLEAIEKTKAAVSHLHTRYIVDMQSMDSTVSEIQRLRDNHLYPKLVALVDGMAKMWETMFTHHRSQLKIVADLRALDILNTPKETTDQHHDRTVQLWRIVSEWHSQLKKLMDHQKEYIKALNEWLRLNLIPIESSLKEKVLSPPRIPHPPIQALLQAWNDQLEKLPMDIAKTAISSFGAVVNSIVFLQEDEMKQKEKCEETRKDLTRKTRAFEDWCRKHADQPTPQNDIADPDRPEGTNPVDPVAERRLVVKALEKKLEEEMETHKKLCRQAREKSLVSLKTHLPELFRAMSEFADASSETYKKLCIISHEETDQDTPAT